MSDRSYKGCDSRDCLREQSTQSSRSASFSNSRSEYDRNLRNTNTGVALHEVIGMTDVSSPSQHSRSSVKSNLQPLDYEVSQPKSSVLITSSKQNKSSSSSISSPANSCVSSFSTSRISSPSTHVVYSFIFNYSCIFIYDRVSLHLQLLMYLHLRVYAYPNLPVFTYYGGADYGGADYGGADYGGAKYRGA